MTDWRTGGYFLNIANYDDSEPAEDGLGSNILWVDIMREQLSIEDFSLGHFGELAPGSPEYQAKADEYAARGPFDDYNTLEPSDYFKLRQVSVSYDLTKHLQNWGQNWVSGLSVGVSGTNLWNKYSKDYHGL